MIKKKAPVIPLTIVVIGVTVAIAVNSRLHPVDPKDATAQQAQQPQQPEGQMRPEDKTSDLKAAMTNSISLPAGGHPKVTSKLMGPQTAGGSLMVSKKPEIYKPKPSSTSTDMMWYKPR